MDELKQLEEALLAGTSPAIAETKVTEPVVETPATETVVEADPIKTELENIKKRAPSRTEKEQAEYNLKKIAERLKEIGGDPAQALGFNRQEEPSEVTNDDDDAPVTLGMLKKMQQVEASKTALQLANEEIQGEAERELTAYYLENVIRSTGNPREDLKLARLMTNSVKNEKIMEMQNNRPQAKAHSSSSNLNTNSIPKQTESLTKEEQMILEQGVMTKEEILSFRK